MCLGRGERMVSDCLDLELQLVVSHLTWVRETNSGPPKEKYMLSAAEPPLQPLSRYFYHSRTRVTRASIQADPPPFPYSDMKHFIALCVPRT